MEDFRTPRKSCDFCYRRKIRCTGQKPRCSQCIIYGVDCTYTAPSRKSNSRKRHGIIKKGNNNTEARFQDLEVLVEQLNERLENAERKGEAGAQSQLREPGPVGTETFITLGYEDRHEHKVGNSPDFHSLPPLQQVLPVVEIFLSRFNTVLPLFHAETPLDLIHDVYNNGPQRRCTVAWAAINIMLALTYQQILVDSPYAKNSTKYLNRAQSVLSAVMFGDTQLLNVQVLVGIVILLEGSPDLQPSLILIATTMRLAHKIGLHDRRFSAYLDPCVARQRAYVFWIAYILDKDLSMRAKQPSVQLDDDINLDLPSPDVIDCELVKDNLTLGPGIITTVDGSVKMNYFLSRIQLAAIEGGVYDYLYSTRSQKRSQEERLRALDSVVRALDQWKTSLPVEFSATSVTRGLPHDLLRFLGVLHSTSLACTALINQSHPCNPQWVADLRIHARDGTTPLLPVLWEVVLDEARDFMGLFGALRDTDRRNYWILVCSYITAIMLLTAKSMYYPLHEHKFTDRKLIDTGLRTLGVMVQESESGTLRHFQTACIELDQGAKWRGRMAVTTNKNRDFALGFPLI